MALLLNVRIDLHSLSSVLYQVAPVVPVAAMHML